MTNAKIMRFVPLALVLAPFLWNRAQAQEPADASPPAAQVRAAALPDTVAISQQLMAATVTVRVSMDVPADEGHDHAHPELRDVTVASGVSLGKGLVVTFVVAPADAQFRLTLPGGEQAEARLQVVDEHSGLTLLWTDDASPPGLDLADGLPAIGTP